LLLIAALVFRRRKTKTVVEDSNDVFMASNSFYAAKNDDEAMEMNPMYRGAHTSGIYAVPHDTNVATNENVPSMMLVRSHNPLYEGAAAADSVVDGPATLFPTMTRNPMYAGDGDQGVAPSLHRNPLYKAGNGSEGMYDK
jgi:hypothetical protein